MRRILVAVSDSAHALAAAQLALELAATTSAEVNFVGVSEPALDVEPVLRHVNDLAATAGITATITAIADGQPFEALLATAHEWNADLIVMGRSDRRRPGDPYVGSQTEHLLEFTDIPVLVVPPATG